jgi:hypothetical protein
MAKKAGRKGRGQRSTATSKRKGSAARRSAAPRRAASRTRRRRQTAAAPKTAKAPSRKKPGARSGVKALTSRAVKSGKGRESTPAETLGAGQRVKARQNPMPTRRTAGSPRGGDSRHPPALDRERRQLRDVEENVPTPPSSLNPDRLHPSAARSGRSALQHARRGRTETSPALTGGDVDADWEEAYAVGDEAPGGDNPTPDQDRVDDIGRAMGVEYADNEELKASDKIAERDRHRWELDPASAEDYPDHKN